MLKRCVFFSGLLTIPMVSFPRAFDVERLSIPGIAWSVMDGIGVGEIDVATLYVASAPYVAYEVA
ncbi:hypothetical protein A6U85_31560 [Agrobacterium sp. 13-626]|nr:hypothetical protein A6U85_31560 [Agrobacterium sp. 13-626]